MATIINTEKCTGCASCEIACSFHHRKLFSKRNGTSIEVKRWPKEGRFGIVLYNQTENRHISCDCNEDDWFCLSYCPDIARDELKAILKANIGNKGESK